MTSPLRLDTPEAAAEAVIDRVGKTIRMALPLGLGKANLLANALYGMAKADPGIDLTILTALTLSRPRTGGGLESAFGDPLIEKFFGTFPELSYATARAKGELPPNVTVEEFFLATGQLLSNTYAQRHYNSVNYTHALRRVVKEQVNVLGQMIAPHPAEGAGLSLSCNPDLSLDLIPQIRAVNGLDRVAIVGEINPTLPWMGGDAVVSEDTFDILLDTDGYDLAGPPAPNVDTTSQAIGIHAARLVKDGGTLQIGIGSLGDGTAAALRLRHETPGRFAEIADRLGGPMLPETDVEEGSFREGLYGCTEMFTQGMLELILAGVISRAPREGSPVVLDGGFFLGPQNFYRALHALTDEQRATINMTRVSAVNQLYGREQEKRRERAHARFINVAMKATCLGAVVSDALEDGRVVSGVGGQYNFVAQAHELEGARSVILLRSTRESGGKIESNVVWSYGHTTVPRHLRDIIITEYGVADLRGQTDEDCVKRMLAITDARFQDDLLEQAKAARKLKPDFRIPDDWRVNTPGAIARALKPGRDVLADYPFGTELSPVEQRLAPALQHLKSKTRSKLGAVQYGFSALISGGDPASWRDCLERVGLADPSGMKEKMMRLLLMRALRDTEKPAAVSP